MLQLENASTYKVNEFGKKMSQIHTLAQDEMSKNQEIYMRYNATTKVREFNVGDLVLFTTYPTQPLASITN